MVWNQILEQQVIIIIFINCTWVVTWWQWLFYSIQNMKLVTNKFKLGGYMRSM